MAPRTFRKLKGLTLSQAAVQLREIAAGTGFANSSVVEKQESGRHFPNPDSIEAWRKWSDGAVSYDDFMTLKRQREAA